MALPLIVLILLVFDLIHTFISEKGLHEMKLNDVLPVMDTNMRIDIGW